MIKRPLMMVCLGVAVFLYLYVSIKGIAYPDYDKSQGEMRTVTGKVYKKETIEKSGSPVSVLYLNLDKAGDTGQQEKKAGSIGKKVICYLKAGQPEAEIGSKVLVQGKKAGFERASNPGQFDARFYYLISGVSYRLNQAEIKAKTIEYNKLAQGLYRMRIFFSQKLNESLPEKEASIMQTMLLGEKSSMDKELKNLYQRNGIAHILAISGLHVSLLGMGIYKLLRRFWVPMKLAAGMAAGGMILYGIMTGFSVSAIRAILMFAIHMAAIICGRTYDMLTAVAVAAVLILAGQPFYFYHSGFVFSFSCVLGIGLLFPALTEEIKERNFLIRAVTGGAAMSVITLPVYLWFYYEYPVCSVLLNLVVIPFMSFLLAAGILLIGIQIIFPWAALPFVLLIQGIFKLYDILLKLCDGLPGSILTVGRPQKWQIILYLSVLLVVVMMKKKIQFAVRWGIVMAALIFLLIHPVGKMQLTFLDVGQGDCIYIENTNGNCYLVDGGSSSVKEVGKYRILPFLKYQGVSHLEAVFVTHPDEDHCNGIRELILSGKKEGILIKHLVLPDIAHEAKNQSYQELERLAKGAEIPVFYMSRGQKITDDRLILTCLHPDKGDACEEANEYSMVLEVRYAYFRAMLTGDLEGRGEQKLLQYLQKEPEDERLTVLKAAHHGSGYSTPDELLDSRMPVYAAISCGRNNSYGHPHQKLLERLKAHHAEVLITYETGAVTFATNGQKVEVIKFLGG